MNSKRAWLIAGTVLLLAAVAAWLGLMQHGDAERPVVYADVLIVTNRHLDEGADPENRFGGDRGELHRARCRVGFRPIPLTDDVARSVDFFVPTEFQDVESVTLLDRGAFDQAVDGRDGRPVVLFVHGYSFGFDKTCRMGAELQRMLGDAARVVMFSWPSDANPADYVADQVDVEWSVPALADLVAGLESRVGAERLRVLAHSLGSRGTLFALDELQLAGHAPPFAGHLILLAPDFDTAAFRQRFDRVRGQVGRITLYASENDTPLKLSRTLHGQPRLGQAGDYLSVLDGMTTIDVSPLGRYRPSGHEYFFYHPIAADDLVESLVHAMPAGERHHTESRSSNGSRYWELVEPDQRATQ